MIEHEDGSVTLTENEYIDLTLPGDMIAIVNVLVQPNDAARVTIRNAILAALPGIDMAPEDKAWVREWLNDVADGRL